MLLGFILIIVFLGMFKFLTKTLSFLIISPVYLFLLFNLLILIFSPLYFHFYDEKFSIARVDEISSVRFWFVLNHYILADILFILGFLIYHFISTPNIRKLYRENFNKKLFGQIIKKSSSILPIAGILTFFILVFYMATYGSGLWFRDEYIPKPMNKALITIAKILSLVVAIGLAIASKTKKSVCNTLMFIIFLLTFSTGSRTTFLLLVIYFFFGYISSEYSLKNSLKFFAKMGFSFLILSYLMSFRSIETFGLKPYFNTILSGEANVVESFSFNIYYSFIFGVFATAKTMSLYTTDWHHMFVSLNPLPGGLVGWPEVAKELLITRFMPYTLHGQVFQGGFIFISLFFTLIGAFFGFFEKIIRKELISNKRNLALFLTLILLLFIVYSFEYHLRSAFRYIYYAFFLLLFVWIMRGLRKMTLLLLKRAKSVKN
jgi:hypothetical protein